MSPVVSMSIHGVARDSWRGWSKGPLLENSGESGSLSVNASPAGLRHLDCQGALRGLMGGQGQRLVLRRGLGLTCAEEVRTGGRGVRAGLFLNHLCIPSC